MTTTTLQQNGRKKCSPALKVFFIALVTAFLVFLPFLIYNHGMFTYYGDFNVQQIPFYQHAHDYLRNGEFGWDWYTDLGSNFLGSYSFYLLGSPFFWITMLFPSGAVPYLIAPLLMLKFACIALSGYAFIERFTKTSDMAIIGALLYAFSGFNIYNIFFNHFHEAVWIFPLLLVALEEEMVNDRRGVFALMVAVSAVINYYFFFGQVVFTLIYFFIRCLSPDVHMTWRKFGKLAFEAVLGVALSAVMLYPSVLAILDNDRITERLYGYDILFYNRVQRYALILESMFMPPDMPARPNFFPDSNAKWSSVSAYLPLFGMVGVIAFLKTHNKHWVKRVLATSFLMALVPILNSLFSALNWNYYARWYYMPLLLMALATVLTFEEYAADGDFSRFKSAFVWCGAVIFVCILIGILPKKEDGEVIWFDLEGYPLMLWIYVAVAVLFFAIAFVLIRSVMKQQNFTRTISITLCICIVSYSWMMLAWGSANGNGYAHIHDTLMQGGASFTLEDEQESFYRVNSDDITDNAAMYWGMASVQAFQSVVPGSIQQFYAEIGYDRNVASRPEKSYMGINGLFSVKYYLMEQGTEEAPPSGFSYYDTQNGYDIYLNDYYLPMGFTYEGFVNRYVIDGTAEKYRDRLMLHGLYLSDEDIAKYGDLLTCYTRTDIPNLTESVYFEDCQKRAANACDSFSYDSRSFIATITLDADNLVFFSVPYEEGWSVTVNGQPREVIRANVGFMAVKADKGDNRIAFTYQTPGLKLGAVCSAGAGIVWILWCLIPYVYSFYCRKKNKGAKQS